MATVFDFNAGSDIELIGGEFSLNGTAFTGSTISLAEGDTFTGVFQDGSAFIFSDLLGDSFATDVKLTTTALPVPAPNFTVDSQDPTDAPLSIRTGQTLDVVEGGSISNTFESVGGTINVAGGSLENVTTSQSSINLSAGTIDSLNVLDNGQVDISGGEAEDILLISSSANISGSDTVIGGLITAESSSQLDIQDARLSGFNATDSVVNVSGDARLFGFFRASNSEINISDNASVLNLDSGIFGNNIEDSELNISGGTIGFGLDVARSTINISGSETSLSNISVFDSQITMEAGSLGDGSTTRITNSQMTLSGGTLGDGISFSGGTLDVLGGRVGNGFQVNTFDLFGTAPAAIVNVSGGEIGSDFQVESTAVANISGGIIGDDFRIGRRPGDFDRITGGIANISGGTIGNSFSVGGGGTANISGGQIGNNFEANDGSVVDISAGSFGFGFDAFDGSQVTVTGGEFGDQFRASAGSNVDISGGSFGDRFSAFSDVAISGGNFGTGFRGIGSEVELQGGAFQLNGVDISAAPTISLNGGDVLTGVLADGSTFILSRDSNDFLSNVTLTNVALPTLDTTPIVVNSAFPDRPSGLRAGQSLTVQQGGVLGNNFEAVDAVVNVQAGTIGDNFGTATTTVNLDGGSIGDTFNSHAGSIININGGSVGDGFRAFDSEVNVIDGTVGDLFVAAAGSEVNISGGQFGTGFDASSNSLVRIDGGVFGRDFDVFSGSDVEFSGGGFQLNGIDFTDSTISLASGDVFTGTLQDGSAFIFAQDAGDQLIDVQLNRTAVPNVDNSQFVVSALSPTAPTSLRAGQTLTLESGGAVDVSFEAIGGVVNINGGSFEDDTAFSNTVVNLNDGLLAGDTIAYAGTEFNLLDGTIEELVAETGSQINIRGDLFDFRNQFVANAGSDVDLFATEFSINGSEVEFLDIDSPLLIDDRDLLLTGVFLDGSEFQYFVSSNNIGAFRVSSDATLQLNLVTAVPEPSSAFLLALGGMLIFGKRRRS